MVPVIPNGNEYLASHGKSGILGRFAGPPEARLCRGDSVILEFNGGLQLGSILCPITPAHCAVLTHLSGRILRLVDDGDRLHNQQNQQMADVIFFQARNRFSHFSGIMEILDVEVAFDRKFATVQFLGILPESMGDIQNQLEKEIGLKIQWENLSELTLSEVSDSGCGKPDCGRKETGHCSTCESSCQTCGVGPLDFQKLFPSFVPGRKSLN